MFITKEFGKAITKKALLGAIEGITVGSMTVLSTVAVEKALKRKQDQVIVVSGVVVDQTDKTVEK